MPPPAQSRALVIQVGTLSSKEIIEITDSPSRIPGFANRRNYLDIRADADPFASLMKEPPADEIVFKCGKAIFDAIRGIEMFDQIVLNPNDHTPVYFKLESPASENLPWEAMWHHTQKRYVALEANWPIARLAPGTPAPWTAMIEPELKMLLVLAAAPGSGSRRVDALNEWNGIWNAVSAYAQQGKLRIHVLYCENEVRDLIEPLAGPGVHVTSEPLTGKKTLEPAIVDMAPNIVHFFCHGSAEHAEPRLNLATCADHDAGAAEGEIWLGLNELSTTLKCTQSIWLVTLNCCQGARATSSGLSIASLLSNEGVPAVVAMRESVDFVKAGLFAGELYRHLLATLMPLLPTEAVAARGKRIEIPERLWLDAMHPPRQVLSRGRRNQDPTWTLPVVYVQRGGVQLRAQPRSGSLVFLCPPEVQDSIAVLRLPGKALAKIETDDRNAGAPAKVIAQLKATSTAAMHEAYALERDALVALRDGGVLLPGRLEMIAQRIDELQRRLG